MKRKSKKLVSLFLAAAMAVTMAGCGNPSAADAMDDTSGQTSQEGSTQESTQESQDGESQDSAGAGELDLTERVDLVFYLLGDPPVAEKEVEDAINEILLEKANATVDFQFSTWTDWGTKYNNALLDGSVDLIYTANWGGFGSLAQSGAFMELDDLLDKVAPELRAELGESTLDMCRVNGKIMTVPCLWKQYSIDGIEYREDLRKKYDLPVPNTPENFEAYILGIQENEPGQTLLNQQAAGVLNTKYPWVCSGGLPYGLAANYDTPADVYDYWFSDDYMEDMKLMKKWADLGFWSKSSLSADATEADYENGQCVALTAGLNPNKTVTRMDLFAEDHPDWKTVFIAYGETTGVIMANHATSDATAITRTCMYPERAMYVLDLLVRDKELNLLTQYGIEGVHYEVGTDGLYHNLSEDLPFEGLNTWSLRNPEYKLPRDVDLALNEMFDKYDKLGEQTKWKGAAIMGGFTEDSSAYSAEKAAIDNVIAEYGTPLQAGQVEDVEAGVELFRSKLKEAGLDTVREAYLSQWMAYCEENGYDK